VLCVQPCFTAVFPESIALFITFFILFNNVVPISLYVTVEMVNFAQAHYIDNDIEMYVTSVMLHVVLLYCCTVVLLYCCTVVLLRSHSVPIQS
jgi:magnesium-transporting ATPase (P-type)